MKTRIFLSVAAKSEQDYHVIVPQDAPSLDAREFVLGKPVLLAMLAKTQKQSNEIPFIFEHGKGPRGGKAAGWFKPKDLRYEEGIGIVLGKNDARWTKTAKTEIDDEEWGYFSPGMNALREANRYTPEDIFEVTLTNIPVLDRQKKLAASRGGTCPECNDTLGDGMDCEMCDGAKMAMNAMGVKTLGSRIEGGRNMDLKTLAKLAGLPETATEQEVEDALKSKLAATPAPAAMTDAQVNALAERLGISKLAETIASVSGKEAEKLMAAQKRADRVTSLLERGVREGKITKAMRTAKTADGKEFDPMLALCEKDPDSFEAYLSVLPKVTPTPGTIAPAPLTDAIDVQLERGSFADVDLGQPANRTLLARSAEKLVADKKSKTVTEATIFLTTKLHAATA